MPPCNSSCDFTRQMAAQILNLRSAFPGENTEWIDHLYGSSGKPNHHEPCCLFTLMLYYGYCKECNEPVSRYIRQILSPLMRPQ